VDDRDGPREVGEEDDRGLQRGDEDRLAARIVGRDRGAELLDPGADVLGREVDLSDPGIV
jgi:hypothetical protein